MRLRAFGLLLVGLFSLLLLTQTEVIEQPTCTEPGIRSVRFLDFPVYEEEIPATGHTLAGGHCMDCFGVFLDSDTEVFLSKAVAGENSIALTGDVVIPEKVLHNGQEKTVVGITTSCFYNNMEVTSVTMPDTIQSIESFAFDGCQNLKYVRFSNHLEYIGKAAFQLCTSLEDVQLPDSVLWIENFAFNHCPDFCDSEFFIPEHLELLGTYETAPGHMFYDCGSELQTYTGGSEKYHVEDGILYAWDTGTLVSIPSDKIFDDGTYVMPDWVEHLGELSFNRNESITRVVLSDNLVIDGEQTNRQKVAFENRGNDLSVAVYGYCPVQEYIAKDSNLLYTSQDGVLYSKDMTEVVAIPSAYQGELHIPDGVLSWNQEALWVSMLDYFNDLTLNQITKISLPGSLSEMDERQLKGLNEMAVKHGTVLEVRDSSEYFVVVENQLIKQ